MITELSQEVLDKIPAYVEKGLRVGLGTETGSLESIKAAVAKVYPLFEYTATPEVILVAGPDEGMKAVTQLKDAGSVDATRFASQPLTWESNFMWGSQELYWLYHYKFIDTEIPGIKRNAELSAKLNAMIELCEQVGWFWPFDTHVVVSAKPTKIAMVDGRLHCTDGPAVEFANGYKLYSLNGVRMTGCEALIEEIAAAEGNIPAREVLSVTNVEQRAELIKLVGVDTMFVHLNPKLLDERDGYELYSVPVYEDLPRIYLKMSNPSVDEIHIEAVHPECTTVDQALNWRNTGSYDLASGSFVAPIVLT